MEHRYEIEESPLPIGDYKSTIKVSKKDDKVSKIVWSSTYTPAESNADAANLAIPEIYQAELDNIQKMAGGTT